MMNTPDRNREADDGVLLILGPTASGKSRLALAAARRFDGVVINADSMQVYRDLRLLSARPDAADEAAAPHRLYGFLDAADVCSAARWAGLCMDEIGAARRAGKLPIIVGGSGLYVRALIEGFSPMPDIDPEYRRAARAMLKRLGKPGFHAALAAQDPETAHRLAPGDAQRMVRAMEVWLASGKPFSHWRRQARETPMVGLRTLKLLLLPERRLLYRRCDARFARMVGAGAGAEAMALAARGLDPELPAMKALGVRELIAAGRGDIPMAQAISDAGVATRRYAKRQMTWLRHQIIADFVDSAQDSESIEANFFPKIREFRLTPC